MRVRAREWLVLCRGTGPGLEAAGEWVDRWREEREGEGGRERGREREREVKRIKNGHVGECVPNISVPLPIITTCKQVSLSILPTYSNNLNPLIPHFIPPHHKNNSATATSFPIPAFQLPHPLSPPPTHHPRPLRPAHT